jgi:hypothetical protein
MSAQDIPREEHVIKIEEITPPREAVTTQEPEHNERQKKYLPRRSFDQDQLREYILGIQSFDRCKQILLGNLIKESKIICQQSCLFSTLPGLVDDNSHLDVYEVLPGGTAVYIPIDSLVPTPRALDYWRFIKVILDFLSYSSKLTVAQDIPFSSPAQKMIGRVT